MVNAILGFSQKAERTFEAIQASLLNPSNDVVMIASHRASHLLYPENSLPAIEDAIKLGIDIAELDIRFTKDKKLVIMHDKTVDRTTTGKGLVSDFTFEELRKLHLRIKDSVTNEVVPTLEEAFALAKGKILIDLDIKQADCVDSLIALVHRTKTEKNCIFFVYLPEYSKMIKEKDSLLLTMVRTGRTADVPVVFTKTNPEVVHIDPSHYNDTVVTTIKSNHARVWINALGTVDARAAKGDLGAFEDVIGKGANIIQTDQPALLKAYLESKKRYYSN